MSLLPLLFGKRSIRTRENTAVPPAEVPKVEQPVKPTRSRRMVSERTEDLLGLYDGGRAGFWKSVQG